MKHFEYAHSSWRIALLILTSALLIILTAYHETFASMVAIWRRSDSFQHCFLIPIISLYLIFAKRHLLAQQQPKFNGYGIFASLITSIVWLIADLAGIQVIQHLSATMLLLLTFWACLGQACLRVVLFPVAYMIFAVPMGDFMVPMLQDVTAYFAVKGLQWTGVPVFLEGRYISIPSGDFEIAEACSGINYLIASVSLGCLYAYLTYQDLSRRLIFIGCSIVVPIIANGLRAYGIIMIAHLTDRKYALGVDHLIYGWLFFSIIIIALFMIGYRFRQPLLSSSRLITPALSLPTPSASTRSILTISLLFAVLAGNLWQRWLHDHPVIVEGAIAEPTVTGWTLQERYSKHPLGARYEDAAQQWSARYAKDGQEVVLYAAYYAQQDDDHELINFKHRFYDKKQWQRLEETKAACGRSVELRHLSGQQQQLWYWYVVRDEVTDSALWAKWYEVKAHLLRKPARAWIIVISTPSSADQKASQTLASFCQQLQGL